MELSIDIVKTIVLASLLAMTFIFGMIPVLIIKFIKKKSARQESASYNQDPRFSKYKRILSFLNCLAAGVFLATCFLDLLPSVERNLTKVLYDIKVYTGFPVAEFVMIFGLFLILIIEQIVLTIKESKPPTAEQQSLLSSAGEERSHMTESIHSEYSIRGICDEPRVSEMSRDHSGHWAEEASSYGVQNQDVLANSRRDYSRESERSMYTNDHLQEEVYFSAESHHDRVGRRRHSEDGHSLQVHSSLRTMLLLFALSLHSVFEGLAIGLQMTSGAVIGIFAALCLHKCILSFSLSMNLVQSKISGKSAIQSVIMFSMSSPFGIVVGIAITDLWHSMLSVLVHGILQGIASGTFLYIIFFEILPKEFNCEVDRLLKVLFLILGYSSVTGVLFLDDDMKEPFCVIKDSTSP